MRCIVKATFVDRFDNTVQYPVGTVLDWDDQERIADCEKRGLIECIEEEKPKKTTTKTTKKTTK